MSSCGLQKVWNYLIKECCVFVCSVFGKKHLRNDYVCCEEWLSCIIFTGLSRGCFNAKHRISESTSFIGLSFSCLQFHLQVVEKELVWFYLLFLLSNLFYKATCRLSVLPNKPQPQISTDTLEKGRAQGGDSRSNELQPVYSKLPRLIQIFQ